MEKFKVLHVGCGDISQEWLDVLTVMEEVEVVGLVNRTLAKAEQKKEHYGLNCEVFEDYKEAILKVTPDVVIDNTPPEFHYEIATFALEHGAHVLSEKPITIGKEQVLSLIETCKRTGKRVIVMQNRRYINQLATLKEIIDSKVIGEVTAVYSDFFTEAHFGGFRDEMEHPLLLEMSIHTYDQARYLLNSKPVSVYCETFTSEHSWYKGNANVSSFFEMNNGVRYQYNGSWCAKGTLTSWESEWRILGTKGAAYWNGEGSPYYEIVDDCCKDEAFPKQYVKKEISCQVITEGHEGCIREMFSCLKSGEKASTELEDNYYSFMMVLGSIESDEKKQRIEISEF